MKFYDIDALENTCGTDNKYEITALVAARARWLSERKTVIDALPANEKYLSAALLEIEQGAIPGDWVEGLEKTSFHHNAKNTPNASNAQHVPDIEPTESVGA
ncbi:MAG: DNA-directed RNA polymerase subunit omega [Synergistaceae bacterium]|jgi:DNA-directed RNA polymerase subunit K/omega|nr:DNA-directed RNA polymerase subunit omega [Synergistaceae bacterium]